VVLTAGGASIAVKCTALNRSAKVRTSLYKRMIIIGELKNLDEKVGMA
jgi:hypothetical protein